MALEATVNHNRACRVVLVERPEGVYVLVFDAPGAESPCEDHLQTDWAMAKRAARQDYGIAEGQWKEIADSKFNA